MKMIFVVMVLAFAFTTGMAVTTIIAQRVMRDLLMFLGRGFALFAGGPAVFCQYSTLSRSAVVVQAQRRGRGPSE
jgi:hypothetical protein